MANFHQLLDRILRQRLSFSIFVRIWLTFMLMTLLALGLTFYYIQKTVRPSAKRVVEDSLVDTSLLLADLVAADVAITPRDELHRAISDRLGHTFVSSLANTQAHSQWYYQKQHSSYHLYITDADGIVIYDSAGTDVGADYGRWNDVYLTLQGKYGARSTDVAGHSVMYVASPIIYDGERIGVLSVGKPIITLIPYLNKSSDELIKITLSVLGVMLIMATLMAWWLRSSVQSVNRYTRGLATAKPPHFYLGRELNELTASIASMKDTIENKAYVTEYVHTLTHELKSPLTAIRASAEILADELSDAERTQFTDIIKSQSDKLTTLVERLLSLAQLEQPNVKLNFSRLNLDDIISACLAQHSATLKQLGKTVIYTPADHHITADEFWFGHAIGNIIDNAIYYGKNIIKIEISRDGKRTTVRIINDSDGLDDFIIERAFERYFSRGHAHSPHKSTGLGLTLVKQVIELHGGSVSLHQYREDDTCWVVVEMVVG